MASLGQIATSAAQSQRRSVERYGDQLLFFAKALYSVPMAIRRYPQEITKTLAEVTFGAGTSTVSRCVPSGPHRSTRPAP